MPSWRGANALYIARKLGLTSSLVLALDAGDAVSLPAASDTWNDLSGNGNHFYLGSGTGADAADPSINGTAGQLVVGNYLGFDGGDRLVETTTHSFAETWHQDGAAFTMLMWVYFADFAVPQGLFATVADFTTESGVLWTASTAIPGQQFFRAARGDPTVAKLLFSTNCHAVAGAWQLLGVSVDEAAGTGFVVRNHFRDVQAATYTSPTAVGSAQPYTIGAISGGSSLLRSGGRLGIVTAWNRSLSSAEVAAFFNATRGRYGV